jgi:hypothetical protein
MAGRHELKLNGSTYYIRKYDAFLAIKILGDLQKQFLGPMVILMEASDENASPEAKMKFVADGIEKISHTLDGDTLVALAKRVLNPDFISVSIGSEPTEKLTENILNRATDSNVADVVTIIAEVLKVNFTEVFTRGRTLIGLAPQATETQLVN